MQASRVMGMCKPWWPLPRVCACVCVRALVCVCVRVCASQAFAIFFLLWSLDEKCFWDGDMVIWPGASSWEKEKDRPRERGERKREVVCAWMCVWVCVLFLTLSSLFLSTSRLILLLEALWIFFTVLSSCFISLSHHLSVSFNVLTSSSPSASLSLPLSPSFNLFFPLPFAVPEPLGLCFIFSLLSPNSISTMPSISLRCQTSRLSTSYCSLCFIPSPCFHSAILPLCVCFVCACTCICLGVSLRAFLCFFTFVCVCVCCVWGPAPPCPLSLERLLSGSLAFQFKLNHGDESSLFFFFLSSKRFIQPSSPICPFFFSSSSSFFLHEGGRKWDKKGRGEERRGGGSGFGVRKQMKAAFFFFLKGTEANCTQCHTQLLSVPESPPASLQAPYAVTKKNTHMISVYYFLPFLSLHHTMSSLLSPPSTSPHSHVWQSESRPGRDKMRPFAPLDWQCLGLFLSAHWSYHYFNLTKYECSLSSVMLQRFFFVCAYLYWLSEPHRDRDMSMQRYTEFKNSPQYGVRTFCPFAIVVGRIMMMRPNT